VASTETESFQVSLDLSWIGPVSHPSPHVHGYVPGAGCGNDVDLGSVYASLCERTVDGGALEHFVAWDRDDP
jgi:hypothetical protein